MASVTVKIHQQEKDKLVSIIRTKCKDKTISVTKIASLAGFNPNRTRFIIEELLEEGRIRRVVTKQYNERYVRYKYEVI